jgi:DNA-binding LacI/PurR family transcriptional regulator
MSTTEVTNRRRRQTPTILDVAARAGVSKSLVSRVLRGGERVSPSRQQAVLEAVAALGYRPNAAARSLVQRRTYNIGVVLSDLHNLFFAEVLDGIQEAAVGLGYLTLVTTGSRTREGEERALEQLLALRVEGIVLAGSILPESVLARAAQEVPVAVVSRPLDVAGVDVVVNDDVRGAGLAVEHLAGFGHRRIALIDGGGGAGARERREGYLAAMARLGLAGHARVAAGDFTEAGGYRGARALLRSGTRPTAILAANDLAAIGALNAIEEARLRVPEDVSLVGYDNTALASLRHISLTTVHQPRREMGRAAMEAVAARIQDPQLPVRRMALAPELVVRSTTAAPGG